MMRCNPRVPKCSWGTVSEVMRAINGRSKKCPRPRWIACFTANVRVFAFMRHLLETEEDNCNREVAAPSLTRLANSSGRDTESKSRLFVGWSMLWVGNKTYARKIFKAEIEDSIRRDHEVGWLRGLGAMHQLENPVYGDHGEVLPDPALQWGRVFSNAIAEEIRDAAEHGGFEMSSLYRKAESET
ncbi:hypothetical protein DIPPA_20028 [Diplonema papillatum]|nr:hypothetical protein DIPPA_20028 [Diplonema papillatum]